MILTNFWYFSYNYAENFHFLENQPLQDDGIIFAENRTHYCARFQKKKKLREVLDAPLHYLLLRLL